jgi:hypothetical protein
MPDYSNDAIMSFLWNFKGVELASVAMLGTPYGRGAFGEVGPVDRRLGYQLRLVLKKTVSRVFASALRAACVPERLDGHHEQPTQPTRTQPQA